MKFTKETLKRAMRTFLQAAIGYIVAYVSAISFSDKENIKPQVISLIASAVAAGIAALMNLTQNHKEEDTENG